MPRSATLPPDPALSAILAYGSPSAAIVAAPVPRSARGTIWVICSMFAAILAALALIPVDKVVTAGGRIVCRTAGLVVQPLETSIIRSIDVSEGQVVRSGDLLARLDPTFATAEAGTLTSLVSALRAEVSRLKAEAAASPFAYSGIDPDLSLQAAIYAQRQSERHFRLEIYQQRISGLQATVARSLADAEGYRARKAVAIQVESMRRELVQRQLDSRINSLAATDNRLEMERGLTNAIEAAESARRDLEALKAERDAYEQNWRAEVSQKLSEQQQRLVDAQEQLQKAQLRRRLVELRASRDATVLTIARVSVGSVLQSGDQLMTLIPADATLEVEARIAGRDDGFVHVGAPVAIKFDTFPFQQYGSAYGKVRTISADSFTAQDDGRAQLRPSPGNSVANDMFYRSRITIDTMKLRGVPSGFHVIPGMPVTADINVGRRTVLDYLLGRILPVASEGMREP
jgi:hemolysin D